MKYEYAALVERNQQGKTEVLGEIPIPVPFFPLYILHGFAWDAIRTSALRGQ